MTPKELVDFVKKVGNYGNIDITDDEVTAEILLSANVAMYRILRKHAFRWSYKIISLAITGGTQTYALTSDVRKVLTLRIGNDVLIKRRPKELFEKYFDKDAKDNLPVQYIDGTRDSSGNLQVIFYPAFTASGTVDGMGFLRITKLTSALLTSASEIPVFPSDTHDVIAWMVLADVFKKRKMEADYQDAKNNALLMLSEIIEDDKDQPDIKPKISQPSRILRVRRARTRGSMSVTG